MDELLLQASRDVDRTLIQWALSLSPLERLRAATSSAASLEALRNAKEDDGRRGELLRRLSEAGVEFILVGGAAAVLHGAPITTEDLDIVPRLRSSGWCARRT